MLALVAGDVDPRHGLARAGQHRRRERPRLGREREHGAVVVGIRVAVQHPRAAGRERRADRVEHREVAALGDVRDGEQHRR